VNPGLTDPRAQLQLLLLCSGTGQGPPWYWRQYPQPSVSQASTSMDSANLGWKIFGKKIVSVLNVYTFSCQYP
jgi:hypothetical protein